MNNAQIGDKILSYDNQQSAEINANKNKIEAVEQSVTALDTKLSKDYIVDSGSNARGNWEKWNSGKLVQWGNDTKTVSPTGTASGIAYQNGIRVNYPINFVTEPEYVGVGIIRTAGLIWSDLFSKSNTGYCEAMVAGVSTNATGILTFYAIGRWK